jgi:hypothetical protein
LLMSQILLQHNIDAIFFNFAMLLNMPLKRNKNLKYLKANSSARDANAEKFTYSPPKQFKAQEVVTGRSTF